MNVSLQWFGVSALLAALVAGGCSMCQDCYDDAPPVIGAAGTGVSGQRAGSILAEDSPNNAQKEDVELAADSGEEPDETFVR
jgi:hypothetical protein